MEQFVLTSKKRRVQTKGIYTNFINLCLFNYLKTSPLYFLSCCIWNLLVGFTCTRPGIPSGELDRTIRINFWHHFHFKVPSCSKICVSRTLSPAAWHKGFNLYHLQSSDKSSVPYDSYDPLYFPF